MNKCIVICDDDEGILDVATIVLEEKGYTVVALTQREGYKEKIKELQPDAILLDLWMPDISGEEITVNLKRDKETKKIPIIIVSASKDTEKIAQTIGADDYINKPFDISELEAKVAHFTKSKL